MWNQQVESSQFFGRVAFKIAADAIATNPEDPYVWISTTMRLIVTTTISDKERSWYINATLMTWPSCGTSLTYEWSDQFDDPDLRLVFSHTPPQLTQDDTLHIIVVNGPIPGRVPSLVSVILDHPGEENNTLSIETIAMQIPPSTPVHNLIEMIHRHSEISITDDDGTIWCEDRYVAYDEHIAIEPGGHILFFPTEHATMELDEESERSDDSVVSLSTQRGVHWGLLLSTFRIIWD